MVFSVINDNTIIVYCKQKALEIFKNGILNYIFGNKLLVFLENISFELFMLHMIALKLSNFINSAFLSSYFSKNVLWFLALLMTILLSYIVSKKPWRFLKMGF